MVIHGFNLINDITLVSTVDSARYIGYFYYKDIPIQYDDVNISRLIKNSVNINYIISNSIRNLERKLRNEVDYILIGDKVRRKLYLWIKDTLTEEVEVEKEFIRKKKWRN